MENELSKYPNLERYVRHFDETGGSAEERGGLPFLIVWIRLVTEPEEGTWTDPAQFFELDDDDTTEFYSWGTNSRWANVFCPFVENNLDFVVEKCIELAVEHGDPSVEEYLKGLEQ